MTKKFLCITMLVLAIICILVSCNCKHKWTEATCTKGSVCTKCGEESSAAKGHSFSDATCTEAQKCSVCGAVGDAALGHVSVTQDAISATCTAIGYNAGTKCQTCSEVLSGCEEIPQTPHSTRLGVCNGCNQLITDLLPESSNILEYLSIADNAVKRSTEYFNSALKLSTSRIPSALNTSFSYVEPAESAIVDAYIIVTSYDEFSDLKSDLETLYAIILYIQDLQATSSNFISVGYNYLDATELYWTTTEALMLKMTEWLP